MNDTNASGRQGGPLNPQALSPEDLVRIVAASGFRAVTLAMVRADLDAGAPRNADGTINLVHFAAWLAREADHGTD